MWTRFARFSGERIGSPLEVDRLPLGETILAIYNLPTDKYKLMLLHREVPALAFSSELRSGTTQLAAKYSIAKY